MDEGFPIPSWDAVSHLKFMDETTRAILNMVAQGYMQQVDVNANISHLFFDLAGAATDDIIKNLLSGY